MFKAKLKRGISRLQENDLILLPFMAGILLAAALITTSYLATGLLGVLVTITLATLVLLFATWILKKEDSGYLQEGDEYLLIIASEALDSKELREELLLRKTGDKKLALTVPVRAKNPLAALASDIDKELEENYRRIRRLGSFVEENNIALRGQLDIEAGPLQSAIDATRKLPVGEVLMFSDKEDSWPDEKEARDMLEGIPVSVISREEG